MLRSCFEKNMVALTYKTVAVRPLASHLTIQLRGTKHTVNYWRNRDTLKRDILQWPPTQRHPSVRQQAKTCFTSVWTPDTA